MRKRSNIIILVIFMLGWPGFAFAAEESWAWKLFKERFIQDDGRVIDRMNENSTHSESIGYALYFALSYGDEKTFDKVYSWMHHNLQKNEYGLYGWQWGKSDSGTWGMRDLNNATDGDMWIARSLLLAYEKKGTEKYRQEALELLRAMRQHLIFTAADGSYCLLPARAGFVHGRILTLNPSYLILHLFHEFAKYDDEKTWRKLYQDSKVLLAKSEFGRFRIHPDWLSLDADTGLVTLFPDKQYFSYDAIRVPLFLAYAQKKCNDSDLTPLLQGYLHLSRVYEAIGIVTQPLDLVADELSLHEAPVGFKVIFSCLLNDGRMVRDGASPFKMELKDDEKDYYSFSLLIFADLLYR